MTRIFLGQLNTAGGSDGIFQVHEFSLAKKKKKNIFAGLKPDVWSKNSTESRMKKNNRTTRHSQYHLKSLFSHFGRRKPWPIYAQSLGQI